MENTINKKYTVSMITLGCKVNQFETEAMTEILEKEGFVCIPPSPNSDIFIINTCAVTKESERKSRQLINKAKRINKNALVVAVGCSVQLSHNKIQKETDVDLIIGTKNKSSIGSIIKDKLNNKDTIQEITDFKGKEIFEELKISTEHDKTRANIKIQDGCSQFCTYCIIPYVRGPIRSRNEDDIISEIKKLVENGYKEIVLNGIHISSYGIDRHEKNSLINLVEKINQIVGLKRIRLGSLEPNIITDDFMKRYSSLDKVCDHFHLSLQSGSDTVLNRMNRRYTTKEYLSNVNLIRHYMPNAGITTDIIVGFPGETEDEYKETYDFVENIKFSRIHVFKYSIREGTKAANMDCQIDDIIKSNRSKKLITLGDNLTFDFITRFIDKKLSILIESKRNDNFFEGYTTNYLKVLLKSDINITNSIIDVKINKNDGDYLIGQII